MVEKRMLNNIHLLDVSYVNHNQLALRARWLFMTSYQTQSHGIIVKYQDIHTVLRLDKAFFQRLLLLSRSDWLICSQESIPRCSLSGPESTTDFDHCDDAYSLSIRVKAMLNHTRFVNFLQARLTGKGFFWVAVPSLDASVKNVILFYVCSKTIEKDTTVTSATLPVLLFRYFFFSCSVIFSERYKCV